MFLIFAIDSFILEKIPLGLTATIVAIGLNVTGFWINANAAKMERLLEDGINAIGLGPQGMGGKYSVMGVNIENTARHPSTIGVAVNVGCWSHRRGHIVIDKELNVVCDTHSTWKFE